MLKFENKEFLSCKLKKNLIRVKIIETTTGRFYIYNKKVISVQPLVGPHKNTIIGTQHFSEVFGFEPTLSTVIDDYELDVRDLVSIKEVTMPVRYS